MTQTITLTSRDAGNIQKHVDLAVAMRAAWFAHEKAEKAIREHLTPEARFARALEIAQPLVEAAEQVLESRHPGKKAVVRRSLGEQPEQDCIAVSVGDSTLHIPYPDAVDDPGAWKTREAAIKLAQKTKDTAARAMTPEAAMLAFLLGWPVGNVGVFNSFYGHGTGLAKGLIGHLESLGVKFPAE